MNQYRLIQFIPDHAVESRITFGAALSLNGEVSVVRSSLSDLPDPKCLGGRQKSALLALLRDSILDIDSFDYLPVDAGTHAVLGEPRAIPASVDNPDEWVARSVLAVGRDTAQVRHVSPHRSTYGTQFF